MKRSTVVVALAGSMSLVLAASASDAATEGALRLDEVRGTLDDAGANGGSHAAVIQTIATTFGVTTEQIDLLRGENRLGYGEIAILLALVEAKYGAITEGSIDLVLNLRQGPPVVGWGSVARMLDLNLGDVVSSVEKVTQRASQAVAMAQQASANGNGNGKSAGASSGAGAPPALGGSRAPVSAGAKASSGASAATGASGGASAGRGEAGGSSTAKGLGKRP